MRRKIWLLTGLTVSLFLGACRAKSAKPQSSSGSQPVQQQESKATENSPVAVEMMTVGTDDFGYVDIPADWISFTDLQFDGLLQYTDPAAPGTSIITLYAYTAEELGVSNVSEVSTEEVANGYAAVMKDNPLLAGIKGRKATIAGHEAYQLYAELETGVAILAWIFRPSPDKIYSVSMEGEPEAIKAMVPTIEGTWRERKE